MSSKGGFRMVGKVVRPVDPMSTGPLSHFIGCEVSSLVRCSAVWKTTMESKALSKSMMVVFAEALCVGKENP